ncbi:hypothetical protein DFH27DRAFT_579146 [Peziza echinospora]|nr:hypothetical protein DFH27DRAFT_579146 [Peziza echinospora]
MRYNFYFRYLLLGLGLISSLPPLVGAAALPHPRRSLTKRGTVYTNCNAQQQKILREAAEQAAILATYAVNAITNRVSKSSIPDARYTTWFQPTFENMAGVRQIFQNIVWYVSGTGKPGASAVTMTCFTQAECDSLEMQFYGGTPLGRYSLLVQAETDNVVACPTFFTRLTHLSDVSQLRYMTLSHTEITTVSIMLHELTHTVAVGGELVIISPDPQLELHVGTTDYAIPLQDCMLLTPKKKIMNGRNYAYYATASYVSALLGEECRYAKRDFPSLQSSEPEPITLTQRTVKKKPATGPAVPATLPAATGPKTSCAKIDPKCNPTADKKTGSTFCSPTKTCPSGQMNDPKNLSVCIKSPAIICSPGQQKTATGCENIKCPAGKSLQPRLMDATIAKKKVKVWTRGCGPKEFDAKSKGTFKTPQKKGTSPAAAPKKVTAPQAAGKKVKAPPAAGQKVAGGKV